MESNVDLKLVKHVVTLPDELISEIFRFLKPIFEPSSPPPPSSPFPLPCQQLLFVLTTCGRRLNRIVTPLAWETCNLSTLCQFKLIKRTILDCSASHPYSTYIRILFLRPIYNCSRSMKHIGTLLSRLSSLRIFVFSTSSYRASLFIYPPPPPFLLPQSLTHLTIKIENLNEKFLDGFAACPNRLVSLFFDPIPNRTSTRQLVAIICNSPYLETLHFGDSDEIPSCLTDDIMSALAQHCPNLKNLYLSLAASITDDGMMILAKGCKEVETIHLLYPLRTTSVGLAAAFGVMPRLQKVNLEDFGDLEWPDVGEMHGVNINIINFEDNFSLEL